MPVVAARGARRPTVSLAAAYGLKEVVIELVEAARGYLQSSGSFCRSELTGAKSHHQIAHEWSAETFG